MEATDIVEAGAFYELPDIRTLEMGEVVVVRSSEVSAEAAVVAGDDDATATGRLLGVNAVLNAEADLADGIAEDGGILVVADAAEVDDAVGGQDVLGAAGGVLGGAAGDQFRVVVVQQLLVQRDVLRLGQDRIVRLEPILVEQLLVAHGLDVWGKEKRSVLVVRSFMAKEGPVEI